MHVEILRFCGTSSGEYLFESLNPLTNTRIYHSDSRGGPCRTRKELLSVIAWAIRRHWFYSSGEMLAPDGRTWKDNDTPERGDGKDPIYILQGLFEAANAGIVYTFVNVELFISCCTRVRARSSSKNRDDCRARFPDLPIYYDSVRDIPEIFFQIRDTREK